MNKLNDAFRCGICSKATGERLPAYIIAEMSANHGQKFDRAVEIIKAAKAAGADAIKLQTYTPDTITIDCDNKYFRIGKGTIWEGKSLYQLYREAYTPWEWHPKLKQIAESQGLDFFSTPFDATAVDFLEKMDVQVYKVASFEVIDIPLLKKIGKTGKPVIMSTGMTTLAEIDEAVTTLREAGTSRVSLLKCTSAYPAPPAEVNLRTIPDLSRIFQVPVGLSDHTLGIAVPVAAVALGARIIEKHLTLSRDIPGPDNVFSLEPHEFQNMVNAIRTTESALGSICHEPTESEKESGIFRRSLFIVMDIGVGEILTEDNVRSIRPGCGISPSYLEQVLGKKIRRDVVRGTPLSWDLLECSQEG